MVYQRCRIIRGGQQPERPWRMNVLVIEIGDLRNPVPQVITRWIELGALAERIKDTKIW